MKVTGFELIKMIADYEIEPQQRLIRLTAQKDRVYLNYSGDLIWEDTEKPLASHSIANYDFEIISPEEEFEEIEKLVPYNPYEDDYTSRNSKDCLNSRINNIGNKINALIDNQKEIIKKLEEVSCEK